MPAYASDTWVFPRADDLVAALVQELADSYLPSPCLATVMPGSAVALDYIDDDECESMCWVRVNAVYPYALGSFPEPRTTAAGPADVLQLAWSLEMGVMRRFHIPDNGEAVDEGDQREAARMQMAEMAAMLRVLCVYSDKNELLNSIGQYAPFGPDGGVVGGVWTATLGVS